MMHVAVCIVGFRNADEIAHCLTFLDRQEHRDFSVHICENGGAEAFCALQAAVPSDLSGGQAVHCHRAPGNIGYAGGVNVAMRAAANADGWWVLNPDTAPEPGALAALVRRVERGDVAGAGGVLLRADGRIQSVGGRFTHALARSESLCLGQMPDAAMTAQEVEDRQNYLMGASMLVTRQWVDTVGLMRDEYFLYCEEVEWCLRALNHGLKLGHAPDAIVHHGQGGTTGSGNAITRRPRLPIQMDERNRLHVVRDTRPALLPIAIVMSAAMILLRYARHGAWRQMGYAFAGWRDGVLGRRGRPDWVKG